MSIELKSIELDVATEVTESIESQLNPYLFGVEEREVAFNIMGQKSASQVFSKTSEYKSIIDLRTNQLISIQPKTYKLVTNKEVIAPLMEQPHQVGGSPNLQHMKGQAVDTVCPGVPLLQYYNRIKRMVTLNELIVDQVIYEFGSWVHISYTAEHNRNEFLKASKINGKAVCLYYRHLN